MIRNNEVEVIELEAAEVFATFLIEFSLSRTVTSSPCLDLSLLLPLLSTLILVCVGWRHRRLLGYILSFQVQLSLLA